MSTPEPLPEKPFPYWGTNEVQVAHRRTMRETAQYGCGIALLLFFSVDAILVSIFDDKEPREKRLLIGVVGGGIGLVISVPYIHLTRKMSHCTLRANQDGIHIVTGVGSSSIQDRDVASLTSSCVATIDEEAAVWAGVIGVAVGGLLGAPVLASVSATSGAVVGLQASTSGIYKVDVRIHSTASQRLRFDCLYRGSLTQLVAVRDEIARRIASQWWEWYNAGEELDWCDGVTFAASGLSWGASWRRPGGAVSCEPVKVLTFGDQLLHLHQSAETRPVVGIRLDRKDAYPGLILLNRIREVRGLL